MNPDTPKALYGPMQGRLKAIIGGVAADHGMAFAVLRRFHAQDASCVNLGARLAVLGVSHGVGLAGSGLRMDLNHLPCA